MGQKVISLLSLIENKIKKEFFAGKIVNPLFYFCLLLVFLLFPLFQKVFFDADFSKNQSQSLILIDTEESSSHNAFIGQDKVFFIGASGFLLVNNLSILAVSPADIVFPRSFGVFSSAIDYEPIRNQIIEYVVQEGDSLSSLVEKFNITKETIIWANDIKEGDKILPGQTLTILPVSGALHLVRAGDTLSEIAKWYKVSVKDIMSFNEINSEEKIFAGDLLIIPGGKKPSVLPNSRLTPLAGSYFITPVDNFRITQGLHYYNAVDLGSPCGTPVRAVAGGTIQGSGYNKIAGNYIRILHPNGVVTFYGHLSGVVVKEGAVRQGEVIGYIGRTGFTTGCHLHFEVRGAVNPFLP